MNSYQIVWLLLPQGKSNGRARFTALAQFRLNAAAPAKLADFGRLFEWPDVVDAMAFAVNLSGRLIPAVRDPVAAPPAMSPTAWWKAIFPGTTPVTPWQQDTLPPAVVSYDLARAAASLADLYATTFTTTSDVAPNYAQAAAAASHVLSDRVKGTGSLMEWRDALKPGTGRMPDDADAASNAIDFHQRVASLDSVPALLRWLRIAVPLSIPAAEVHDDSLFGAIVVAQPTAGDPLLKPFVPPRTRIDASGLLPAGGRIWRTRNGFLNTTPRSAGAPPVASLVAVDAEGSAVKLQGLVATAAAIQRSDAATAPLDGGGRNGLNDAAGLPPLRVQGLALALADQANTTLAAAALAAALQPTPANPVIEVDADSLVTGWRIDVQDQGPIGQPDPKAPFRSLHARSTTVAVDGHKDLGRWELNDEGCASEAGVQQGVGQDVQPVMAIAPALAVWKGWSLSVPVPWRSVEPAPDPKKNETPVAAVRSGPIGSLPIDIQFPAAHGLPRLRYGHVYAVRARAVDASGWSLPAAATTPAADAVTATAAFLRTDPVAPPVTAFVVDDQPAAGVQRTADGLEGPQAGESVDRLAIRTLASDPPAVPRRCRRLAAPSRTTFETAERHGLLDDANGRPQPALHQLFFDRDRTEADGSPLGLASRFVALEYAPQQGQFAPVGTEAPKQAAVRPLDPLPYLPEPLARRVRAWITPVRKLSALPQLPSGDAPAFRRAGVSWDNARPFLIELEAAQGTTTLRLEHSGPLDRLIVGLLPGEVCRLHLAGLIENTEQARLFQLVDWAIQRGATPQAAARAVIDWPHWMVTPRRTLECVHAVDRPLVRPAVLTAVVTRDAGKREATIAFKSPCHVNSTGRIEVLADWVDPVGTVTPNSPPSLTTFKSTGVFDRTVADDAAGMPVVNAPASTVALPLVGTHSLPDTAYRRISYLAVASSRFREYMAPDLRNQAVASPLDSAMVAVSAPAVVFVPSSAPPPAPVVGTIVPAFKWLQHRGDPMQQYSRRAGRTLRIDLGPRWFDSGFNEMLAVITNVTGVTAFNHLPASEWGDDPLFASGAVPALTSDRFPLRRLSPSAGQAPGYFATSAAGAQHKLELEQCPVGSFQSASFAAHLVDHDQQQGHWFCDVQIDAGTAYRPMVRLALARFQPSAVKDDKNTPLNFSSAVRTDFLPLLPDRAVVVDRRLTPGLSGETWTVRVCGPAIDANRDRHLIVCSTQVRAQDASADFGWTDLTGESQSILPPYSWTNKPPPQSPLPPLPQAVADLPLLGEGVAFIGTRKPNQAYRVLVREFELLQPAEPGQSDETRLVFFDTFDL